MHLGREVVEVEEVHLVLVLEAVGVVQEVRPIEKVVQEVEVGEVEVGHSLLLFQVEAEVVAEQMVLKVRIDQVVEEAELVVVGP